MEKKNNILNDEYILDTVPPMSVGDVLSTTDGVYFCIKNEESVFLWVNDNFAQLFGKTPEYFIGRKDDQAAHVAHDKEVMASGEPLLNLHETIEIPDGNDGTMLLEIVTQKGLLRQKKSNEIIGITVCFSKRFPHDESEELIETLDMEPTGIGGYIALGPSSDIVLKEEALPLRFNGTRKAYSMNYFLLQENDVLNLHMLNQDEQWFYHEGSAIKIHMFFGDGSYKSLIIGSDLPQGQQLQGIVPHNCWFGAELLGPGYILTSCSLAPGWDEQDSIIPSSKDIDNLKNHFPDQSDLIDKLIGR